MYVYMYTCIYIYIHTYIHIYTYIYTHRYTYTIGVVGLRERRLKHLKTLLVQEIA